LKIAGNSLQPIFERLLSNVLVIHTSSLKCFQDIINSLLQSLPGLLIAVLMDKVISCLNQPIEFLKDVLTHIARRDESRYMVGGEGICVGLGGAMG